MIAIRRIAGIVVSLALAAASTAPALTSARTTASAIPRYQHIFIIVMENHAFDQIIGNPAAPSINSLANTYGLATNYYGVTHPSEPNYVASIGGSYFGIQDDNQYYCTPALASTDPLCKGTTVDHTVSAKSLADQLTAAGLTWKGYFQSLPPFDPSNPTNSGPFAFKWPSSSDALYASKHNPFINFTGTQHALQNMVDDSQLARDLQSGRVPNLGYIVPNQCNDMHGTGPCPGDSTLIPAGDTYVHSTVQAIMSSSTWQQGNNAIVITWDEDDFATTNLGCCNANPGGGHVATIVITSSQGQSHVVDATPYNHYALLQTVQQAFGLGCLQNTCDTVHVKPMAPLFGQNRNGQ